MTPTELSSLQNTLRRTNANWLAGHNPLLDLAREERLQRLGAVHPDGIAGLRARETRAAQALAAALEAAAPVPATVPAAVDWRAYGGHSYISCVKDQGGCGSCVAFGTSATIDGAMRVIDSAPLWTAKGNTLHDVSEAQLYYCSKTASDQHNCASGWWPDQALAYAKATGLAPADCFPYTAGDQPCHLCPNWNTMVTKVNQTTILHTVIDMRQWLATKGPLICCFTVYDDFFAYQSGVYTRQNNTVAGGHCVCCIGYSNFLSAWLCKNSWGPTFGIGGYFWIGYGQCGIDAEMWGVDSFSSIYHT
jgi:C1A family cysteine protease